MARRRYRRKGKRGGTTLHVVPLLIGAEDSGLIAGINSAIDTGDLSGSVAAMKGAFSGKDLIKDQIILRVARAVIGPLPIGRWGKYRFNTL